MENILLTSNFLITLIKAIKKNKIVIQNGWDGYRINLSTLSLKVVARSVGGQWKLAWSRRWALPTKWNHWFWDRARTAHEIAREARTARSFAELHSYYLACSACKAPHWAHFASNFVRCARAIPKPMMSFCRQRPSPTSCQFSLPSYTSNHHFRLQLDKLIRYPSHPFWTTFLFFWWP